MSEDDADYEFYRWYQKNSAKFRDYTLQEVIVLAIACGFTVGDKCEKIHKWLLHSRRITEFWESPFREKWVRAWLYQVKGPE